LVEGRIVVGEFVCMIHRHATVAVCVSSLPYFICKSRARSFRPVDSDRSLRSATGEHPSLATPNLGAEPQEA